MQVSAMHVIGLGTEHGREYPASPLLHETQKLGFGGCRGIDYRCHSSLTLPLTLVWHLRCGDFYYISRRNGLVACASKTLLKTSYASEEAND
jgi:hypothetical protein